MPRTLSRLIPVFAVFTATALGQPGLAQQPNPTPTTPGKPDQPSQPVQNPSGTQGQLPVPKAPPKLPEIPKTSKSAGQDQADLPPVVQRPPADMRRNPDPGRAVPIDKGLTNHLLRRILDPATLLPPRTTPGAQLAPRRVTLMDAVRLALDSSNLLRLSAETVNRARGHVNEARAGFLPTAGVNVGFTRLDEGSSIQFPGANGQVQNVTIVNQNQKQLSLAANLPIDISGLIATAVEQNQFLEIAARLDYNATRNQVVLNAKNAYFAVLRAKALAEVADQTLQNGQDQLKVAEANLRAGTGTRFDVLRAQTGVANLLQNQITARNRVTLNMGTLNYLMGIDQNTPTDLEEVGEETNPADLNMPNLVTEAYGKRPEILQADANIRAAEKGVRIAQRSTLPSLGLSFGFQYQPDTGGFAPKTTSYATVATVNMPIFDAGVSAARVQQAKADVNSARVNKQVAQDTVALDVRQQYLSLVEAQDRLNVTTAALVEAEEQYRLAGVRFREGVTAVPGGSPLLEVSDALAALATAQSNQVDAQYDLQQAKARLDQAVGRYSYDATGRVGLPAPRTGGR
jgi:outer membrane protein